MDDLQRHVPHSRKLRRSIPNQPSHSVNWERSNCKRKSIPGRFVTSLSRGSCPTDSILAFEQGRASEGNGDLSGAKEALEASLKLNPTYFQARLLLGKIDLELQDLKAAGDEFEAALLLQPENKEARLGKAKALFAAGKFLEVVRQLEPMARSQSSDVAVFELGAELCGVGRKRESRTIEE